MNPLRAWKAFWFGPISAKPLGAFRIAFGLAAMANLAILCVDLTYWLTGEGLLQGSEAAEVAGRLRPSLLQWVQEPAAVRLYFAAMFVVTALLTVGWHTRVMAVLFYAGMHSIHHRMILTNSGADALLLILAFYLMLSPSGAAYSLDARRLARRRGTAAEPLIVPWAQRLIQLHVCLIYWDTAMLKCNGATWLGGTALHFVVYNNEVGRFQLEWLAQYPLVINALTYGGLAIEFSIAFLLWFRASRPWAIAAGLALHGGILLLVNIPIFGELMAASYLAFLTPNELQSALQAVDPRRWFRDSRQAPPPPEEWLDETPLLRGPHFRTPAPQREEAPVLVSA